MAGKVRVWKAPTVESFSTGLTYVALTGALLLPMATAGPRLPPAVETKATMAAPLSTPVVMPKLAATEMAPASTGLQDARPATRSDAMATSASDAPRELYDRPPAQIAEARSRLKAVKAKDAPVTEVDPSAAAAHASATRADETAGGTADVRVTETTEKKLPSKVAKLEKPLPPAAAVVPPASTEPVNTGQTAPTTWSDSDVAGSLKECLRLLAPVNAEVEVISPMRKGQCGSPAPIMLKSVGTSPKLTFEPAIEINCQMAVALGEWATQTLQPAARETYASEVRSIVDGSGYSCRNRYGLANERLSEHALANAVDIGGFALANGKTVRVTTGWGSTARDRVAATKASSQKADIPQDKAADDKSAKAPAIKAEKTTQRASLKGADLDASAKSKTAKPVVTDAKVAEVDGASTPEGKFLRRLHDGACETFGTVLGPEANEAHRDHFHFDMKARKRRAVCQ